MYVHHYSPDYIEATFSFYKSLCLADYDTRNMASLPLYATLFRNDAIETPLCSYNWQGQS